MSSAVEIFTGHPEETRIPVEETRTPEKETWAPKEETRKVSPLKLKKVGGTWRTIDNE